MPRTLFRTTRFELDHLVKNIERGDIALPELQRPFVWPNRKVRDLLDSMLRGFPVGYLLFWVTGAEVGARAIGVGDKDEAVPRWLIVDGQQRLTSVYSVFTAHKVVREDYSESRIRIAFRPHDARFEVTDAAIEKDPEFLADVTPLWTDYRATVQAYFDGLEAARGPLTPELRGQLDDQFDRVRDLRAYPFEVVELDAAVEEEHVAEVFVRINSEGVTLNQADFILTLMSVFREKARKQLEEFARAAKQPSVGGASAFNWYIQPQPDQLLRVAVAVAFRRAVLKHVYSILRGKDLETGERSLQRREEQFDRLQRAQDHVVNLLHWHEFLQCLELAGFRGSKMISGGNAILYSYALWLIGRVDYQVPLSQLKEIIARWFFMAHTTGRYSGSFETRFEADVARLSGVAPGDRSGFIATLDQVIRDTLTADYWDITLPNNLATSASKSPALLAYIAALNVLDADVLLSTSKIRSRLDPAITLKKGIERHHLFPKGYLKSILGISDTRRINQIANFALVDWVENIAISDHAPSAYWPAQLEAKGLAGPRLREAMYWHALPDGWTEMPYDEFLEARRKLMASVVRDALVRLADASYQPASSTPPTLAATEGQPPSSMRQLVDADLVPSGTTLVTGGATDTRVAHVLPDGRLYAEGETYDSLIELSEALGISGNPWSTWAAELADGRVRLSVLREAYTDSDIGPNSIEPAMGKPAGREGTSQDGNGDAPGLFDTESRDAEQDPPYPEEWPVTVTPPAWHPAQPLLEIGRVYTRVELQQLFSITDATLRNGVFPFKDRHEIWLFVTEQKAVDQTPYKDELSGDTLYWQGQTAGRTDALIINHRQEGNDILVFYRKTKDEFEDSGFRLEGSFDYVSHSGKAPTSFVLERRR